MHDDDPDVVGMFDDLGQFAMLAVDPDYQDFDPELVVGLHALRADRIGLLLARGERVRSDTVGRNDTSPCGSGKKYKKWCRAAE